LYASFIPHVCTTCPAHLILTDIITLIICGCIQKFPDWIDNEIYSYNNKYPLRSNTKGYGGKTHCTDSQSSNTTAPSGAELY
jgi:hypothetical protein